mgnify:CR=1 FL=1
MKDEDPDIFNDILYADSKCLQEKRGAPPIDCSFKELASQMTNVTENGFVKKQVNLFTIGICNNIIL